jgi:hypothetical protein
VPTNQIKNLEMPLSQKGRGALGVHERLLWFGEIEGLHLTPPKIVSSRGEHSGVGRGSARKNSPRRRKYFRKNGNVAAQSFERAALTRTGAPLRAASVTVGGVCLRPPFGQALAALPTMVQVWHRPRLPLRPSIPARGRVFVPYLGRRRVSGYGGIARWAWLVCATAACAHLVATADRRSCCSVSKRCAQVR